MPARTDLPASRAPWSNGRPMRLLPTTPWLAVALTATLSIAAAGCASAPPARLDDDDLAAWSRYLAPRDSELAWESLPWLSSYSDGVLAAQEQRRPLLLWVMNGHPLGCT